MNRPLPTGRHVPCETDNELNEIHARAAKVMGYSMVETDLFDARRQYAQNYPGDDGPERHLKELIRRSERQMDESIALGRKGAK